FTTAGVTALAMFRNVSAFSAPVIGALFIGGTETVCASDAGVSPMRDDSTMPTASDATAMSGTYSSVILRVDILFSLHQTNDVFLSLAGDRRVAIADDHVDLRPDPEVVEIHAGLNRETGARQQPPVVVRFVVVHVDAVAVDRFAKAVSGPMQDLVGISRLAQ